MKDLYGLRKEHIEKLMQMSLLDEDTIVYPDGISSHDSEPLYVVGFNTSEESDKAYNAIFGNNNEFQSSTINQRTAKIIINKSGGTASEGSVTYRITIPNKWAKDMGLAEDNRNVSMSYDSEKKEIKISAIYQVEQEEGGK